MLDKSGKEIQEGDIIRVISIYSELSFLANINKIASENGDEYVSEVTEVEFDTNVFDFRYKKLIRLTRTESEKYHFEFNQSHPTIK
jgi:hypothetical protein